MSPPVRTAVDESEIRGAQAGARTDGAGGAGLHNVRNALAAAAACRGADVCASVVARARARRSIKGRCQMKPRAGARLSTTLQRDP